MESDLILGQRREQARKRLDELQGKLQAAESVARDRACVYVTGSFGREEASVSLSFASAACVAFSWLHAPCARAQDAARGKVSLAYRGLAECPDTAAFRAAVGAWRARTTTSARWSMRVRSAPTAPRVQS